MVGKVAVITGAASGLGLALTKRAIANNMSVIMADRNVSVLSEQVHTCNAISDVPVIGIVCDVGDPESVRQLAEQTLDQFGQIDWLINNAGISGSIIPFWEMTSTELDQVISVNLMGALHCTKAFLPAMFTQSWRSRVINIGSIYSVCTSSCMSAYSMSKHALLAFSESLYFDMQRLQKPVDVSIACPSFMNTSLLANSSQGNAGTLHEMLADWMTRSREVDDIAACIIREAEKNIFYILPDQEIKQYADQRMQSFYEQKMPARNSLEKLITALNKRVLASEDERFISMQETSNL